MRDMDTARGGLTDFTDRLEYAMAEAGFGDNELAREAKVSQGYISKITERRGSPRASTGKRLADALGVSFNWLMVGEGEMRAQPSSSPPPALTEELLEQFGRIVDDRMSQHLKPRKRPSGANLRVVGHPSDRPPSDPPPAPRPPPRPRRDK